MVLGIFYFFCDRLMGMRKKCKQGYFIIVRMIEKRQVKDLDDFSFEVVQCVFLFLGRRLFFKFMFFSVYGNDCRKLGQK